MKRTPLRRTRMRVIRDIAAEAIWSELRAEIWQRDRGRCLLTGQDVALEGAQIHHRQLRSRGGSDEHANLVTLSGFAHDVIHRNPQWASACGYMVPGWSTPEAWPVLYQVNRDSAPLWALPALVAGSWTWITATPHPDQHAEPAPWEAL